MLMLTKKINQPCQALFIDWRVLDNYNLFIDDLEIPIEEFNKATEFEDCLTALKTTFKSNVNKELWPEQEELRDQIAKDLKKIKGVNESLQLNENVVGDVKKYFLGKLQKIKKELSNPETIDKIKVTAKLLALYAFIGLFFKDQFDKGRLTPMADGKVYSASDLNNITKDYVSILKSAK